MMTKPELLLALATRLIGEVTEVPGAGASPFIQWCHESVGMGTDASDEIAWCSSFVNRLAWILKLDRSRSAAARSWLLVGTSVPLALARPGDIVIIKRGSNHGPEVTSGAPGHVFIFAGLDADGTLIRGVGGNQSNGVTMATFPVSALLGVRRLA